MKVNGETPFQVPQDKFSVSPSSEGYILNYSADGILYTAWPEATPANEVLVVEAARDMFWKLAGNASEVNVQY